MYLFMYVCMFLCMYLCMYMYVIAVVCMYVRTCVRAYVCKYVCTYVQNISTDKMHVQTSKVISSHQNENSFVKYMSEICGFSSLIEMLHSTTKTLTRLF